MSLAAGRTSPSSRRRSPGPSSTARWRATTRALRWRRTTPTGSLSSCVSDHKNRHAHRCFLTASYASLHFNLMSVCPFMLSCLVHRSHRPRACLSAIGQRTYTGRVPITWTRSQRHWVRARRIVLILLFVLAQDDDEFAVPANFGIIPDYLDSLDR